MIGIINDSDQIKRNASGIGALATNIVRGFLSEQSKAIVLRGLTYTKCFEVRWPSSDIV